ncbi:MAG TPA: hypothetical protein VGW34_09665 [Allosphingosinicella sp.]|nr:hypothetical protein [Allosphingosinicella sp.]
MHPLINDATTAFLRALGVNFVNFGNLEPVCFEEIRSRSWASATFAGARHEVALRIEGDGANEAADAFLRNLRVAEFELRGHILADIALVAEERLTSADGAPQVRIRIEALTVEDG